MHHFVEQFISFAAMLGTTWQCSQLQNIKITKVTINVADSPGVLYFIINSVSTVNIALNLSNAIDNYQIKSETLSKIAILKKKS